MPVIDRRSLDFLLFDWLRMTELLDRSRFADHDRESIAAIISLAEKLSEDLIAPYLRSADSEEPWLDSDGQVHVLPEVARAVRATGEAGLFSSVFDADRGGLQLPYLVHMAAMGVLMSGSISIASFMLLTVANARLIATFGSPAQAQAFAEPQIEGKACGTMCLSEPHAGSSLADITTRAERDGEDALGQRYLLFGSKMWISAGDHDAVDDIFHLVLARADGASTGLSLFIVPKRLPSGERNDITVSGLNHKMGYRGIPNCALTFGGGAHRPAGRDGAVGWLVGELGQGLRQMFQMMNEARVSVGLGGAILACRGFQLSCAYASERLQGRLPGRRDGGQVPIVEHADVQRMLLAQKAYAEGALSLVLYTARLLDVAATGQPREREDAEALLAVLTPIAKTWPSEWAQQSLSLAIQIHGGAGYTRDFDVELLYRDNRLNPIHEGTTGVQGIDLVGRKLRRDGGSALRLLIASVRATIERARSRPALRTDARAVADAWTAVEGAADWLLACEDDSPAVALATPFLFAMGHAVVAWLWLDQAVTCDRLLEESRPDRELLEGKLVACHYFCTAELPKVPAWLAPYADPPPYLALLRSDIFRPT